MTTLFVVDDNPDKRRSVIMALSDRYTIEDTDQPDQALMAIETRKPAMVLINQTAFGFNANSLFLHIKERYPKMPVLLYVLREPDATRTLKQTISMALKEKPARPKKPAFQMLRLSEVPA